MRDFTKRQGQSQEFFEQGINVHITLISSKSEGLQQGLIMECLGKGVLDSGCSKTVAVELWLNEYIETPSENQKSVINEREREGERVNMFFGLETDWSL